LNMTASNHPRFRYVNEAVGIIFLVTVLLFVAAVLGSGQFRNWLNPGKSLKVIMPAEGLFGLSVGASVEILGTDAGKVMNIVIDPDQKIYAEVQIKKGMDAFVRRDSRAVILKRFGVAGASYLEITKGIGEPLDWEYAVITAEADRAPTATLTALIDELQKRIIPVIDDLHVAIRDFSAVAKDLQDPDGGLKKMLTNMNDITGSIARGEGTIGRLIVQKQMADTIEGLLVRLDQTVQQFDPILLSLGATSENVNKLTARLNTQAEDLPELSRDVQDALGSLNRILADVRETTPDLPRITRNVGDATTTLPVLLMQTQQVMTELERLLQQLQSSWLLGGSSSVPPAPARELSPLEVRP